MPRRAGAVTLKMVNGKLVSARSKTGNPACSEAMSRWVRSRHGGAAVGAEVFKVLAKCRQMASQNKRATSQQASGKLAEGRGTWQRSDKARAILEERKKRRSPAPTSTSKKEGGFSLRAERAEALFRNNRGDTPAMFAGVDRKPASELDRITQQESKAAARKPLPGQKSFPERSDTNTKDTNEPREVLASYQARKASRKKAADRLRQMRNAPVREMKPDKIAVDPERFQYKLAAAEGTGSVGSLAGVKKWDSELGGVLQVWRDPANGKTYVVNGHNRLDLAKKLGAKTVTVRFIQAKDATEARAKGALTNIAEGRGNSIDAAKFFRDTGISRQDLEERGIPLREKIATEGLALSTLEPKLFRRVVDGDMPVERATIIGASGLDHPQQSAVATLIDKRKGEINNRTLRELVDNVRASSKATTKKASLFGDDEEETSLALHRAAVQGYIKERLAREKRVFGTVAKSANAADLERAGNVINAGESGKVSQQAAENLATFDTLKNRSGAVGSLLTEAEKRLHAGEHAKKVYEDVYKRLPEAIKVDIR